MSDAAYMDAVRRGDLVTAQRLVDAAAKAAGYNVGPVYHATTYGGDLTVFDTKGGAFGKAGYGSYFSDEKGASLFAEYGDKFQAPYDWKGRPKNQKIFKVYLKINNPLKVSHVDDLKPYIDLNQSFGVSREYQKNKPGLRTKAEQIGYDGIITTETTAPKVHKTQGLKILGRDDPKAVKFPVYVVFSPSQIKSADPVTYDDAGQVIPLSHRFNSESPDIRNPRNRTIPKQFPYAYAAYLKAHFPDIWKAGGNIRGNDTFRWWSAFRKGDRSPTVMHWWNTTRPAWIARHYRDHRLPGVIAQIKWGTVGTLGVAGMKRVVEDAIRKKL